MESALWLFLPAFTALGSALLTFFLMQARAEVLASREREQVARLKAELASAQRLAQQQARAVEEETRRKCLEEFLGELRVEERHYIKESKSLFMSRKSMVLQERLFFRNIPLSNWITHELPVEENTDMEMLARACSAFTSRPENGHLNRPAIHRASAVEEPGRYLPENSPQA